MAIVNRRNAVIGWLVLKAAKGIAREKTQRSRGRLTSWRRKTG